MGLQRMSERNIRKISGRCELDLDRVWGGSGYCGEGWYSARTVDGRHVQVRKDGTWRERPPIVKEPPWIVDRWDEDEIVKLALGGDDE